MISESSNYRAARSGGLRRRVLVQNADGCHTAAFARTGVQSALQGRLNVSLSCAVNSRHVRHRRGGVLAIAGFCAHARVASSTIRVIAERNTLLLHTFGNYMKIPGISCYFCFERTSMDKALQHESW